MPNLPQEISLEKGYHRITDTAAWLTIFVTLKELLFNFSSFDAAFYLDLFTCLAAFGVFLVAWRKNIQIRIYFALIAGIIFFNSYSIFFHTYHSANFGEYFLLSSIFLSLIYSVAAFIVSRPFSLVLVASYILSYGLLAYLSGNPFLKRNMITILPVFIAYAIVFNYFVRQLENLLQGLRESENKIRKQNEDIQIQYGELIQQREEILAQQNLMEIQKSEIEKKNSDLHSNLMFGHSIQQSILPNEQNYLNYLPGSFILHIPKDIISGDFYWIREKNGKLFIAAIDCTGHGVSGALVSMIMYLTLNRVIDQLENPTPAKILNRLDSVLIGDFNSSDVEFNSKVGMDIALVGIDLSEKKIQYSGAMNPLYFIRNRQLSVFRPNRRLLGIEVDEFFNQFEDVLIDIQTGDTLYIFSDGLPDQFGGPKGKKLGYKRFRELLLNLSKEEISNQQSKLVKFFHDWKGSTDQVDDILIMGVRF